MLSPHSSPSSSPSASSMSSPEIRVTDDHGNGAVVQLPAALAEQIMVEQRTRALTFEVPVAEKQLEMHARPASLRSASSETAMEPLVTLKPAPTSNPLDSPVSLRGKGKEVKRVASAHGSLRMSLKSMTSAGLLSSKKKHATDDGKSSTGTSGAASPTQVDTPEVKVILAKKTCPDLDAVSRALESLGCQDRPTSDPLVLNLKSLEQKIKGAREDCSKMLTRAMQARDRQQYEVCRALCIQIVQNQHSKVETRVYAYNILSTQASPGQAMNFLKEAAKLAKQCEGPEKDKLTSIVAMLQEHALSKESNRDASKNNEAIVDLGTFQRRPTMPKMKMPSDANVLQLPKDHMPRGAMTPKSEKIFNWALPSKAKTAVA